MGFDKDIQQMINTCKELSYNVKLFVDLRCSTLTLLKKRQSQKSSAFLVC